MRIAQIAPLAESVPPEGYGGTERVVSYLTERLVAMGHEVTLFASGDSVTAAELVPACPRSLRLDTSRRDRLAYHVLMIEHAFTRAADFDIMHFHTDYLHFPLSRRHQAPSVTTLHGRLDLPDLVAVFGEFSEMSVVSISDAQREPLPWLNWAGTVHHGLPPDQYRFNERAGPYLLFLGRLSPEKRVDLAVEIAGRAGLPLKVAAKVDPADREYYEGGVEEMLRRPGVDYVGEVDEPEKRELLAGARALIFPIDWPEPFGLVMIEAMASGTPVVAMRRGSVPEVIDDGVTGFVVDDVDGAVGAVARLGEIDRRTCRRVFEERFTDARMGAAYLDLYARLVQSHGQRA